MSGGTRVEKPPPLSRLTYGPLREEDQLAPHPESQVKSMQSTLRALAEFVTTVGTSGTDGPAARRVRGSAPSLPSKRRGSRTAGQSPRASRRTADRCSPAGPTSAPSATPLRSRTRSVERDSCRRTQLGALPGIGGPMTGFFFEVARSCALARPAWLFRSTFPLHVHGWRAPRAP